MHRAHGNREDALLQLESLLRDRISRTYHPGPEDEQELRPVRARPSVYCRIDDLGQLDLRRCVCSFGRFNKSPKEVTTNIPDPCPIPGVLSFADACSTTVLECMSSTESTAVDSMKVATTKIKTSNPCNRVGTYAVYTSRVTIHIS